MDGDHAIALARTHSERSEHVPRDLELSAVVFRSARVCGQVACGSLRSLFAGFSFTTWRHGQQPRDKFGESIMVAALFCSVELVC